MFRFACTLEFCLPFSVDLSKLSALSILNNIKSVAICIYTGIVEHTLLYGGCLSQFTMFYGKKIELGTLCLRSADVSCEQSPDQKFALDIFRASSHPQKHRLPYSFHFCGMAIESTHTHTLYAELRFHCICYCFVSCFNHLHMYTVIYKLNNGNSLTYS